LSDRSYLRAADRLLLTAIVNIVLMLAYAMSLGPARRWRRPLQVLWCRALCSLAGLRVRQSGRVRTEGPTLFVANHVSYLDIPVIARYVDATFVAKAEVARWPLFGQAAKLTRTIFIQRVGAEARAQGRQMLDRLASGENLMLFAEGTSTDGSAVAPFKSSLFGIAEDPPPGIDLAVQPVSISYTRALNGKPLVGRWRELYCWFGEATMLPHLWRMVSLPGAEVELRFHEPIAAAGMNRKELARRAQASVAAGVAAANAPLIAEVSPVAVQPEEAVSSAPDEGAVETNRSAPAFH
jgi:lyso-ornithine lipid O-acyltransferase